jgi:hypothetical protein
VVCADQKRGAVEHIHQEPKSDWGMGEHQGHSDEGHIEQSCGIAVMASLFLLRACHHAMVASKSWSSAQLQPALRFRVIIRVVPQ